MHIIQEICSEFDKSNIKYCHFKSNQHLDRSFAGKTDFDILADHKDKTKADLILQSFNCKRFSNPDINNYPGVDEWLAFDSETGIVYHIHLHFQLISGKAHIKEYALPFYELLLDTAITSPEHDIKTSNPDAEMLLLLSRIVIKARARKRRAAAFGIYRQDNSITAEFIYLLERINESIFAEYASRYFTDATVGVLLNIVHAKKITATLFRQICKPVIKELKINKRLSDSEIFMQKVQYFLLRILRRFNRKHSITRKVTDSGGKIIAFIGVDGSGKSTISKEILQWLSSSKIEARSYYMAIGTGSTNVYARLNRIVKKTFLQKIKVFVKVTSIMNLARTAKDNKKKLIQMYKYKTNGGFSVLDRFPQIQSEGDNDGPKLRLQAEKYNSTLLHRMAKRELKHMQIVNKIQPDIVFRLNISVQTCLTRKPEHTDTELYLHKIESLNKIDFPKSTVYNIDAEQNYEQELLEIKRLLWESIG